MTDTNLDDETLGNDESVTLIQQFNQSMNKRLKVVREEEEKIRKEKEMMNAVVSANIKDDDIIEINVGCEMILGSKRSTLCLAEGSMFSNMFSGRWDDALTRDKEGRVFIDEDPELIKIIVNFLRRKKREDPDRPIYTYPMIPEDKKEDFLSLLNYFGLTCFFFGVPFDVSEAEVVQPHTTLVATSKTENKLHLTLSGNSTHHFLYIKKPLNLASGTASWKVTVDLLPGSGWIYMGVIQNLSALQTSYDDSTSYGWACDNQCYIKGQDQSTGWTGFTQGECLYFHIKARKLTMHSVQKNLTFFINIENDTTPTYMHFNMHTSTSKVTVESLSNDELSIVAAAS